MWAPKFLKTNLDAPFAYQADCEQARKAYVSSRHDSAATCIQAKVFVNAQK